MPSISTVTLSLLPTQAIAPLNGNVYDLIARNILDRINYLLALVIEIFIGVLERLIFFPAPSTIPGLNFLWQQSLYLFLLIWTVTTLGFLGAYTFFPTSEKYSLFEYASKSVALFFILAIGQPFLDNIIRATNALGTFIYPQSYNLSFVSTTGVEFAGAVLGSLFAYLIAVAIIYNVSLGAIALLIAMLGVRAVLIYTIYAFFPLFLALWHLDYGPFSQSKNVATLSFKVFSILLGLGIIVAAILAVGASVGGTTATASADLGLTDSPDISPAQASNCDNIRWPYPDHCQNTGMIVKLMFYFGSLFAAVAILSSGLAMLTSVAGAGGTGGVNSIARKISGGKKKE